jgi:signal peptidase II
MQDETRTPLTTHNDPPAPHEDRGPDQTTPQTRSEHAGEPGGIRPPGAGGPHVSPARRRRLFALLGTVAVLAYVSDQVTKLVALDVLADGQPRPFIGDFISFRLIGNPGAALSLGAGNTWVMTLIAAGVLVAIVFVAKDLGSRAWALALGLLLGSALGNLTDRFVRPPGGGEGHVVDFLDYNGWFIGNVADIWIVGAAGLIILLALRGLGVDGRFEHDKGAPTGAPGGPEQEGRTDA